MFECYFLKINIAHDKHRKKMHNNFENRTDVQASTQVERKFGWQQEKYYLAEEKELEALDKNVTSL